jgi:C-terminal processing protease CtpA/Prc
MNLKCPRLQTQIFAGDLLVSVNLFDVEKLNHYRIVRMVRGMPGTRVKLGLLRPPETTEVPDIYYVTLERAMPSQSHVPAFGMPRREQCAAGRKFLVM